MTLLMPDSLIITKYMVDAFSTGVIVRLANDRLGVKRMSNWVITTFMSTYS